LNIGSRDYDPLFEYGFGLTYADKTDLPSLSEDPGEGYVGANVENYFTAGKAVAPWKMYLADGVSSTLVEDTPALSPSKHVEMISEDDAAQEDIKTLKFSKQSSFTISSSAIDLSRQSTGDMAVYLRYRINEKPEGELSLAIEGPEGGLGSQTLSGEIASAEIGQWKELLVKLSCFCDSEKLKLVTSPVVIRSTGKASISISDIRLKASKGKAKCLQK